MIPINIPVEDTFYKWELAIHPAMGRSIDYVQDKTASLILLSAIRHFPCGLLSIKAMIRFYSKSE
jgi:hypothetical protein